MQAGKTALVRVKAATAAGRTVKAGGVMAEFWEPGLDPVHDASVRDHPDHTSELIWDETQRAWCAHVSTEGWAPGTWTFRGRAATTTEHGPARGWSWGTLVIEP